MYVRSSLHSVRFGQLLRRAHKRIVNRIKVHIERNNKQVELIRFRKNIDSLTLETSKRILSRPTCLRMESRSNICLFDSNHFKLHFNRLFRIRFQHVSHVVKIVYK